MTVPIVIALVLATIPVGVVFIAKPISSSVTGANASTGYLLLGEMQYGFSPPGWPVCLAP